MNEIEEIENYENIKLTKEIINDIEKELAENESEIVEWNSRFGIYLLKISSLNI